MNIWLVMLAGGLLTFAIRLSFIYLFGRIQIPEILQRALRFVPPAVLSAIIAQALFIHAGKLDISPGNERLLAGLFAIGVGLWRRSILLTLLAGMAALLILRLLQGG